MKYTPIERYLLKLGAKAHRLSGKNIKLCRGSNITWWCPPNTFAWRKVDDLPFHNEAELLQTLRGGKPLIGT